MIIFTLLGILTAIFFFIVILMTIIETRVKNRRKEKLFWNMENLDKNRTYKNKMKNNRIPSYYIGRRYKIEARKVIEDFDLSYNLGTAVTYLLRADRKHDSPIECIQKAINHLEFELDRLNNDNNEEVKKQWKALYDYTEKKVK